MNLLISRGRRTAHLLRFLVPAAVLVAGALLPTQADASDISESIVLEGNGGWVPRPSLHVGRGALDTATVDGRIYVVGGFQPATEEIFKAVEVRSVGGDGQWHFAASMHTKRANPAAAELNGLLYVAGGAPRDEIFLDTVERFDPRTGVWTFAPKLPVGRLAASAASVGGLLYVAGGYVKVPGGDQPTASVVAFDPKRQNWKPVAPMTMARARLRLVAADGHLYAIGGEDKQENTFSSVERYDPGSNTWTMVASMHLSRSLSGVTVIRQEHRTTIAVVAGLNKVGGVTTALRSTEVYDVSTDRWRTLRAQLPRATASLVAATESNGSVLAIGGGVTVNGKVVGTEDVYALRITH